MAQSASPSGVQEEVRWPQLIEDVASTTRQRLRSKTKTSNDVHFTSQQTAQLIDHTLLSVDAQPDQIVKLCKEAVSRGFKTVCVRPAYVALAVENLIDSAVGIACVIGFPEGTQATKTKVEEAKKAVTEGAKELDMVLNYEQLKAGHFEAVSQDIKAVRDAAPISKVALKVILETSQLTQDEVIAGCVVSCRSGANFAKTSTGFCGRGATVEDVELMRAACDAYQDTQRSSMRVHIKASGGIRTAADVYRMVQAGAERIGASAGVAILDSLKEGKPESKVTGAEGSY